MSMMDLSGCDQFSVPQLFTQIASTNLHITALSLESCSSVNNEVVKAVLKNLHNLQHLNISLCDVTDTVFLINDELQLRREMSQDIEGVDFNHYECGLVSVDVSGCRNLTSTAIRHLCTMCGPCLRNINISCTEIDCMALLYLSGYNLPGVVQLFLEINQNRTKKFPAELEKCLEEVHETMKTMYKNYNHRSHDTSSESHDTNSSGSRECLTSNSNCVVYSNEDIRTHNLLCQALKNHVHGVTETLKLLDWSHRRNVKDVHDDNVSQGKKMGEDQSLHREDKINHKEQSKEEDENKLSDLEQSDKMHINSSNDHDRQNVFVLDECEITNGLEYTDDLHPVVVSNSAEVSRLNINIDEISVTITDDDKHLSQLKTEKGDNSIKTDYDASQIPELDNRNESKSVSSQCFNSHSEKCFLSSRVSQMSDSQMGSENVLIKKESSHITEDNISVKFPGQSVNQNDRNITKLSDCGHQSFICNTELHGTFQDDKTLKSGSSQQDIKKELCSEHHNLVSHMNAKDHVTIATIDEQFETNSPDQLCDVCNTVQDIVRKIVVRSTENTSLFCDEKGENLLSEESMNGAISCSVQSNHSSEGAPCQNLENQKINCLVHNGHADDKTQNSRKVTMVSKHQENIPPTKMYQPSLLSVDFSYIQFIGQSVGQECLKIFLKSNSCLQKFSITWKQFKDEILAFISTTLTDVREISLVDCEALTTVGISELGSRCSNLRKVDLQGVYSIKNAAVYPFLKLPNLESLRIAEADITDGTLFRIGARCSQMLTELDLSWCEDLTERGLNFLCTKCVKLKSLSLRHCSASDLTLRLMAENLQNLTFLNISGIDTFGDHSIDDSSVISLVGNLHNLQYVDLSWNSGLMDSSIKALLSCCIQLKTAILSGLKRISSQPFLPIISDFDKWKKCRKLIKFKLKEREVLQKSGDPQLSSDEEYEDLYMPHRSTVYAPNLRFLDLEYCDQVTDKDLAEIVAVCRGSLQIIDYYREDVCPALLQ
ncbi:hypothetical protein KUTeg_009039 [Tegillarca granosa]|uniref:F-box/LRR-repeat protein 15-like leucin rich repeat domain-containing protein n=1 Tax=Tegillarca granosa TaxID=220873 RepID=A0ABQ9F9W5_TEGGR|nr:hypothetical protein KUTeg_009039 [Tegillarca granosa]